MSSNEPRTTIRDGYGTRWRLAMTSRLPTFWASLGYAQASLPLTTCSWQLSSSGRAYQSSNLDGKEPSKAGPRIQSTIPRRRMRSVTPSSASLEFRLSGCRSSLFDEPPVCTSSSTRSAYVATRIALVSAIALGAFSPLVGAHPQLAR